MTKYVARRVDAESYCGHTRRTVGRRSSRLQGNCEAPERTHESGDRVHGVRRVASTPFQPPQPRQVDRDALRNLLPDGGEPDAAVAAPRCCVVQSRLLGSGARTPARSAAGVCQRNPRRSSDCRGHTACRRAPWPGNMRTQTPDDCPRRPFGIEDWTRVPTVRDTAPSRRCGQPRRVLIGSSAGYHTCIAGLPSCTGLMIAARCSRRRCQGCSPKSAAGGFAAVAGNQSQELRCW